MDKLLSYYSEAQTLGNFQLWLLFYDCMNIVLLHGKLC